MVPKYGEQSIREQIEKGHEGTKRELRGTVRGLKNIIEND